jgi:hypothetical protein
MEEVLYLDLVLVVSVWEGRSGVFVLMVRDGMGWIVIAGLSAIWGGEGNWEDGNGFLARIWTGRNG